MSADQRRELRGSYIALLAYAALAAALVGCGGDSHACGTDAAPPPGAGLCDGLGRGNCMSWARDEAGATVTAYGTCGVLPTSVGVCVRADRCAPGDAIESCTCGSEPPCGDGLVCASSLAGQPPRCVCRPPD